MTFQVAEYAVGDVISSITAPITLRRAGWYSIGLFSGASGELKPTQMNIHTSREVALSQGLTGPIADGMHSTNWLSKLLAEKFGDHYIARGALRTKYIKTTPLDVPITCKLEVTAVEETPEGVKYVMDAWTENEEGVKLTVGAASVVVAK